MAIVLFQCIAVVFCPLNCSCSILESGEFCEWPKLNTRGYPCTLGAPTQSVLQKGYPLAQAYCTAFAPTSRLVVWLTTAPHQAAVAACASPRRCPDGLGSTA